MSIVKRTYSIHGEKSFEIYIFMCSDNTPLFKAKDAAEAVGFRDTDDAIRKHVDDEDKITWCKIPAIRRGLVTPSNWHPKTIFINESGLYSLMLATKKPEAKVFKRWVTSEILPSIHKTGGYNIHDRNGTSVAEYDKKLADGQMELMKAQLLVANLQTQLSNHGAEITQTVAKYDARIAELQLENEKVVSKYDARIAESQLENEKTISALKSEHQREIAALKEHEFKLHLALRDMMGNANNATAQFFANALLANDNIAENDELRSKITNMRDRVSPALHNRPDKREVVSVHEYVNSALQTVIRCTRSQRKEMDNLDNIRKRYAQLPIGVSPPSKRYRWLAKALKVSEMECANAVTVWNRVRADNPHLFYGLPYVNKCKTEMIPLTEAQLRAKYAEDVRMCERNLKSCAYAIAEFEALGLADADDCVRKCLVDPARASTLVRDALERVVRDLERETEVVGEPVRRDNASERYTAEQLRNCVQNYGNYCINNVFNINFFAGASPAAISQ
ncbi:Bro20 [Heliothis virescens ascovirus 3g]|uniref:Bro20 n=1 Tax=Heliothis virescens ascovirus 3g TaxID=1246651 RepID=K4P9L0_9VIRU|nr:anti-repressor Ant [Heliothis virescens ascovirus 3g]AFV50414.1 Bro20 [Heliothis virescens ascovirus 3g]